MSLTLRPPADPNPYQDESGWYAAEVALQVASAHGLDYPSQVAIEAGINAALWPGLTRELAEKLLVMFDTMFS